MLSKVPYQNLTESIQPLELADKLHINLPLSLPVKNLPRHPSVSILCGFVPSDRFVAVPLVFTPVCGGLVLRYDRFSPSLSWQCPSQLEGGSAPAPAPWYPYNVLIITLLSAVSSSFIGTLILIHFNDVPSQPY